MANAYGQNAVRAGDWFFENIPQAQQHPFRYDECTHDLILQQYPVTEEEHRAHMRAFTCVKKNEWALD
eukprot:5304877-Pyramimonas_sp.AAC.1